jgi:hypothetical protein
MDLFIAHNKNRISFLTRVENRNEIVNQDTSHLNKNSQTKNIEPEPEIDNKVRKNINNSIKLVSNMLEDFLKRDTNLLSDMKKQLGYIEGDFSGRFINDKYDYNDTYNHEFNGYKASDIHILDDVDFDEKLDNIRFDTTLNKLYIDRYEPLQGRENDKKVEIFIDKISSLFTTDLSKEDKLFLKSKITSMIEDIKSKVSKDNKEIPKKDSGIKKLDYLTQRTNKERDEYKRAVLSDLDSIANKILQNFYSDDVINYYA